MAADVAGNYSYVRAYIDFTRYPSSMLFHYFVPGVLMVLVSMLGFLIDPRATPARVTLGVVTILTVQTNLVAMHETLPPGADTVWLSQFLIVSLGFNVVAFIEQVAVSFGLQAASWLDDERRILELTRSWKEAIGTNRQALSELFREWDTDGDGMVSKREFRKGVTMLRLGAPVEAVNDLYDAWDVNGDGLLSFEAMYECMSSLARDGGPKPAGDQGVSRAPCRTRASAACLGGGAPWLGSEQPVRGQDVVVHRRAPRSTPKRAEAPRSASSVPLWPPPPSGNDAHSHSVVAPPSWTLLPAPSLPPSPPPAQPEISRRSAQPEAHADEVHLSAANLQRMEQRSQGRTVTDAPAERRLRSQLTRDVRKSMKRTAFVDLDKGRLWAFKYYHLFPCLQRMRKLDQGSRWIFTLAYAGVVLVFLAGVDFGQTILSGASGTGRFPCLDQRQSHGRFKFAGF